MTTNPIVLILGAGARVGASVAEKFAKNGYKIALASRSGTGTKTDQGYLSLKADFTKPDSIPPLFDAIKTEFKAAPNVVIYNAASLTSPPEQNSVLSLPVESFVDDLNINTISAYVAAQQAVNGWKTLPAETKKTFIYTGNCLNVTLVPVPIMLTLGTGKSASSYWVSLADTLYSAQGYRFYYADERQVDGKSAGQAIDGPAHGEFFAQLADHKENMPWHATFVKGKGYVQFK